MNKLILSIVTALTLGSATLNAMDLYQDANGQLFATPAQGRTLIKDKSVPVFANADKLKFSGVAFLGYRYTNYNKPTTTVHNLNQFEIRRAYLELRAHLLDDPKSYYRITLDVLQNTGTKSSSSGSTLLRAKYIYLYLHNVLASTSVQLGLVHRPWHDYEQNHSWNFRDISKILLEQSNGANLSNSADFGFDFITKTKHLDVQLGIYNGEGYNRTQNAAHSMSFEWRATSHLIGGQSEKVSDTYFDVSFFGQYNKKHRSVTVGSVKENQDLIFGGLHTIYNQPGFLFSAQYIKSQNTSHILHNISGQAGSGYNTYGEYRIGSKNEYRFLARYDSWTPQNLKKEQKTVIAGIAWDQSKNVQWIANVTAIKNQSGSVLEKFNGTAYMLTARVKY